MIKSKQVAKSALIIMILTLGGKILSFIREQLIATKFGADASTDTYLMAVSIVSVFSRIVTASINTTTIPVLSEIEIKEGKEGKKQHTNNLLNIIILISTGIIIMGWFLTPSIMKILASGFEDEQFELAVWMTRIGLLNIIFASIVGVFRGYLQSELRFTESAATVFPFNLIYILFLIFLSGIYGIKGLIIAFVLAVFSQVIIQIPGIINTGYKYKFILNFKDKYVGKIIYLIPPVLISVGINDINNMIDKSLGSRLVEGSISALNYANKLDSLTIGIFISAIITVIYPILSLEVGKEDKDGLKRVILQGINAIVLITIPATVGMIVLANPIVKVAFQRGKFDSTAAYMTAEALMFYSIGLIGNASNLFLAKIYYSLQDTKIPMYSSIIAVVINVSFNFMLIGSMQHRGLALATSISAISTSLYLLYRLKKRIGHFNFSKSIVCGLKSLAAASIMGIIICFLNKYINFGVGILSEFIALLVLIGIGALIYLILIYLLKVEEIGCIMKAIKKFNK